MIFSDEFRAALRDYPYLGSESGEPIRLIGSLMDRLNNLLPAALLPGIHSEGEPPLDVIVEIPGDAVREIDTGVTPTRPGSDPRGGALRVTLHFCGFHYEQAVRVWRLEATNTYEMAQKLESALKILSREYSL